VRTTNKIITAAASGAHAKRANESARCAADEKMAAAIFGACPVEPTGDEWDTASHALGGLRMTGEPSVQTFAGHHTSSSINRSRRGGDSGVKTRTV
jgi:hypothetical protein